MAQHDVCLNHSRLIKKKMARTKTVELARNRLDFESSGLGETLAVVVVYCSKCGSCEAVKYGERQANGEQRDRCKNPHYDRDDLSHALSRQRYERERCNHNKINKEI